MKEIERQVPQKSKSALKKEGKKWRYLKGLPQLQKFLRIQYTVDEKFVHSLAIFVVGSRYRATQPSQQVVKRQTSG